MTTFQKPSQHVTGEEATSTHTQLWDDYEEQPTAQHQMRDLIDAYDPGYSTGDDHDGDPESRQRKRFGGVNWGAGFFGWLDTVTMAVLLTGGVLVALSRLHRTTDAFPLDAAGSHTLGTIAIAACFGVLLLAYLSGGYVAGRMSRFDGAKQGVALWVIGLMLTSGAVGAVLMLQPQTDLLSRVNLPALSAPPWAHGMGAVVVGVTALLSSLLAAAAGGALGCRYHRKVNEAAYFTG